MSYTFQSLILREINLTSSKSKTKKTLDSSVSIPNSKGDQFNENVSELRTRLMQVSIPNSKGDQFNAESKLTQKPHLSRVSIPNSKGDQFNCKRLYC